MIASIFEILSNGYLLLSVVVFILAVIIGFIKGHLFKTIGYFILFFMVLPIIDFLFTYPLLQIPVSLIFLSLNLLSLRALSKRKNTLLT